MLGKKSQRALMSCRCSPGGEQGDADKGGVPGTDVNGAHEVRHLSPFGHLFRFAVKWFGFTGLYAVFSVCPFCGRAGCPVGAGITGSVGVFFALCATNWRPLFQYFRDRHREKTKDFLTSVNGKKNQGVNHHG